MWVVTSLGNVPINIWKLHARLYLEQSSLQDQLFLIKYFMLCLLTWLWFDVSQSSGTAMWPTFLQRVGTTFDCGRTMQVTFDCSMFQSCPVWILLMHWECWGFLRMILNCFSVPSFFDSGLFHLEWSILQSQNGRCTVLGKWRRWLELWLVLLEVLSCCWVCENRCLLCLWLLPQCVHFVGVTQAKNSRDVSLSHLLLQVTKDSFTITLRWTAQMRAEKYEMQMQEPVTESIGTWVTVSSSIRSSQYVLVGDVLSCPSFPELSVFTTTTDLLWNAYSHKHVFVFDVYLFEIQRPTIDHC